MSLAEARTDHLETILKSNQDVLRVTLKSLGERLPAPPEKLRQSGEGRMLLRIRQADVRLVRQLQEQIAEINTELQTIKRDTP